MNNRELVLQAVHRLPEDASLEEFIRQIAFVAAVKEGLAAADRGETFTLEQVRAEIGSWPTE